MRDALFDIPWHQLLAPENTSWLEKMVRPAIIYGALLFAFRFISKRGQAQATLFDFLILLLISNVVQNAMIGDDNSVGGALAGAAVLLSLSYVLDWVTSQKPRARRWFEGRPVLLVKDGAVRHDNMHRMVVSRYDLTSAVRKQGLARLADVGYAYLELDGSISIIRRDDVRAPLDCLPDDAE